MLLSKLGRASRRRCAIAVVCPSQIKHTFLFSNYPLIIIIAILIYYSIIINGEKHLLRRQQLSWSHLPRFQLRRHRPLVVIEEGTVPQQLQVVIAVFLGRRQLQIVEVLQDRCKTY